MQSLEEVICRLMWPHLKDQQVLWIFINHNIYNKDLDSGAGHSKLTGDYSRHNIKYLVRVIFKNLYVKAVRFTYWKKISGRVLFFSSAIKWGILYRHNSLLLSDSSSFNLVTCTLLDWLKSCEEPVSSYPARAVGSSCCIGSSASWFYAPHSSAGKLPTGPATSHS